MCRVHDDVPPVRVFTEGACFFSGTRRECGAVGVYVSDPGLQQHSRARFSRGRNITNQSMQLEAVKQGLAMVAELQRMQEQRGGGARKYECVTSSAYVIKFLHKWSVIWERTGWVTKNKQDVKNAAVLKELLGLANQLPGTTVVHWCRTRAEPDSALDCMELVPQLTDSTGGSTDGSEDHDVYDMHATHDAYHAGHAHAVDLAEMAAHEGGRIGCRIARGLHVTSGDVLGV